MKREEYKNFFSLITPEESVIECFSHTHNEVNIQVSQPTHFSTPTRNRAQGMEDSSHITQRSMGVFKPSREILKMNNGKVPATMKS